MIGVAGMSVPAWQPETSDKGQVIPLSLVLTA